MMPQETSDQGAAPRPQTIVGAPDQAFHGVHELREQGLTTRQRTQIDEHQDELMAMQSVDGRSPTSRQRSAGWQMLALGFGLVVCLIIIVAVIYGVPPATAIRYAVVLLALLSIGGMPIWVLVNWRGTEERAARRQALHEQGGPPPPG